MFTDLASPETRDKRQFARLVFRVQLGHQHFEVFCRGRWTAFQANRVQNTPCELDMRAIRLTGAVADPDHVTGTSQPFARCRILTRQRLFIFEQQRLVAGVEIYGLKRVRAVTVHTRRFHEIKRVADAVRHITVLGSLLTLGETQRPAMHLMHVRKTAGRERAQEVQRRRRLRVCLQHLCRIGNARLWCEIQIIDDVATVAGKLHAIHGFGGCGTRLGELARHAANFDHRHLGAKSQNHCHLQHDFERVADRVGAELVKRLGAVSALQQKGLAAGRGTKLCLKRARLTCKDQRRIFCKLGLCRLQLCGIRIVRHLYPRFRAPA